MHNLISVRNCVVVSLQGAEARQNRIVDSFYEDHPLERIKVFLLEIFVPLLDFMGHIRLSRAASIRSKFLVYGI